jgi:hypothetical protein
MHSSTSSSDATPISRVPWAFLTALAIFGTIEFVSHRPAAKVQAGNRDTEHDRVYERGGPPGLEQSIVQWKVHNLLHSSEANRLVVTGDSSCLMGLRPDILEPMTGMSTINLGTLGYLWPDGTLNLLDLYLDQHPAPRLVVLHLAWETLARDAKTPGNDWWSARLRAWLNLQATSEPAWQHWAAMLPSFRLREWRDDLARLMQSAPTPEGYSPDMLNQPRGPYPSDNEVRATLTQTRGFMTEPHKPSWGTGPAAVKAELNDACVPALRAFAERGRRYGFEVMLLMEPYPECYRHPTTIESAQAITRTLKRELADCPNLHIDDDLLRFYPSEMVASLTHLAESGAERDSNDVGDRLANRFPTLVARRTRLAALSGERVR